MHIVIIGNGISGITAARQLRKLGDDEITVISEETEHFYSRTALMYIYMGHMRYEDTKPYEDWFWKKNKIQLKKARVDAVDFKHKSLNFRDGTSISYDKLILALGSKSNKFGWPGQDLDGVSGLYHYQDLEKMEAFTPGLKRAVIVGGGLIGIEMAEMFHSRSIPVTMVVRELSYWNNVLPPQESEMVNREIRKNHIDLKLGSNLQEIIDDGSGKVAGIIIKESGEKIECGYVGLTPGVSPNVDFLKDSSLEIDRGILVNEYLETNIEDVYAVGDCSQHHNPPPGRRPIEAVWYTGRMMGETVAYNIKGNRVKYDPGIWFNSAKFIDIEYQIYGDVPKSYEDPIDSIYWENPMGNKSIRLVYNHKTGEIIGFNLMGVRYRHEVCEKWLSSKTHIEEVLKNLKLANFDPEFFPLYEDEIINIYNGKTGKNLKSQQKRSLSRVLSFLKK